MSKKHDHPTSLLLVEGKNDLHVISSLCNQFNIPECFSIKDCESVEKLEAQIPVQFKASKSILGIIVDADTDLQARWDSVKSILQDIGFVVVEKTLPEDGLIISDSDGIRRVGVWIMPNNNLNGMLEDFITFFVPKDDQLLAIVDNTLNDIERNGLNKYSLTHKSKARIHSWLSLQEDPGSPLGQGITKRYLTTDEATCQKLMNWITNLFCV